MLTKASLKNLSLQEGQIRVEDVCHNAGWYNSQGVKIGWGDLSPENFYKIKSKLLPNEVFVILSERDSFWAFVTEIGLIGSMSTVKPEERNPGLDYISEKASWIITPDVIYRHNVYFSAEEGECDGVQWHKINSEDIKALLEKST